MSTMPVSLLTRYGSDSKYTDVADTALRRLPCEKVVADPRDAPNKHRATPPTHMHGADSRGESEDDVFSR